MCVIFNLRDGILGRQLRPASSKCTAANSQGIPKQPVWAAVRRAGQLQPDRAVAAALGSGVSCTLDW